MPNCCENWVRLMGSVETIATLQSKPFMLYTWVPLPAILPEEEFNLWMHANWGTRWIGPNIQFNEPVILKQHSDTILEAHFRSAWTPPIPFYKKLVEHFPELVIEYEYSEIHSGIVGHGTTAPETREVHYTFDTQEEIDELKGLRCWHVSIWNPHGE
jgi:hypothetical protein